MYKVVYGFIDVVEDRNYNAGDPFVVGPKTDNKRIRLLSGYDNNLGRPLIEKAEEPVESVKEFAEKSQEVSEEEITAIEDIKPLGEWTLAELKEAATARGLEVKARSTKAELISQLNGE